MINHPDGKLLIYFCLDTRTGFECNLDIIRLECTGVATINVTSAYYGQYTEACSSECCAPHPTDECTELVEEYHPIDWAILTGYCDGLTVCEFENQGALADTCVSPYMADFLIINYSCFPGEKTAVFPFIDYLTDTNHA